jgi:hypothetical protein
LEDRTEITEHLIRAEFDAFGGFVGFDATHLSRLISFLLGQGFRTHCMKGNQGTPTVDSRYSKRGGFGDVRFLPATRWRVALRTESLRLSGLINYYSRDVACSSQSGQRATSQRRDISKQQTAIGIVEGNQDGEKDCEKYIGKEKRKDREHDVPAGTFYL